MLLTTLNFAWFYCISLDRLHRSITILLSRFKFFHSSSPILEYVLRTMLLSETPTMSKLSLWLITILYFCSIVITTSNSTSSVLLVSSFSSFFSSSSGYCITLHCFFYIIQLTVGQNKYHCSCSKIFLSWAICLFRFFLMASRWSLFLESCYTTLFKHSEIIKNNKEAITWTDEVNIVPDKVHRILDSEECNYLKLNVQDKQTNKLMDYYVL